MVVCLSNLQDRTYYHAYTYSQQRIIFSTKNLLNKRNELVTKSKYDNKFYLPNYKGIAP